MASVPAQHSESRVQQLQLCFRGKTAKFLAFWANYSYNMDTQDQGSNVSWIWPTHIQSLCLWEHLGISDYPKEIVQQSRKWEASCTLTFSGEVGKEYTRTWSQTWSSPSSLFVAALSHLSSLLYMGYVPMSTVYQVHWILPDQVSSSVKPAERTLNSKQTWFLFFSLEINSREILSSYPRRPVLRVGYALKLCPHEFSDVLGLTMCVVCVRMWKCIVCMIRQKWKVD